MLKSTGWQRGLSIAALLACGPSFADCVDGVRELTSAELDFLARAQAALVAGLPEAIRPIERRSASRPPLDPGAAGRPGASVCRGAAIGSFSPSVVDGFLYTFSPAEASARSERRRQLLREAEALEQLSPDQLSQRKSIEDRMRAAYAAVPRRQRSDPPFTPQQQAEVDRLTAEGRKIEDELRRFESDQRALVKPQTEPLRARADELQQGPQIFTVAVSLNVDRTGGSKAGEVVSVFGTASPRRSASLKAENVQVAVRGPEGPARAALVSLVDTAYFQSLIGQPLPDVAASRARVERSITAAASAPPLVIASTVPLAGTVAGTAPAAPAATSATATPSTTTSAPPSTAPSATTTTTTTARAPCPPAPATPAAGAGTAAQGAAAVGSALFGQMGRTIGGALGALADKPAPSPAPAPAPGSASADCPR